MLRDEAGQFGEWPGGGQRREPRVQRGEDGLTRGGHSVPSFTGVGTLLTASLSQPIFTVVHTM